MVEFIEATGTDDAIYSDSTRTDQLFPASVNPQFTREQLEHGVSSGFNDFVGPAELSPDVVEAVIANGQVASNGFIVVEDEVFADEANIGDAGLFQDLVGNVRVLDVAPGTSDRDLRDIVTREIERVEAQTAAAAAEGQPGSGISDLNDLNDLVRASSDFQNGITKPVELVEEAVEVHGARIDAAISGNNQNLGFLSDVDVNEEQARQLVDERCVLNANDFVLVEDDQCRRASKTSTTVTPGSKLWCRGPLQAGAIAGPTPMSIGLSSSSSVISAWISPSSIETTIA